MRNFRVFVLVFLTISFLALHCGAQQKPAKKKSLSLDTDDVSTTRAQFPIPDSVTRAELSAIFDKVSSFRCDWESNYGDYRFEAKGEFESPDREHVTNIAGNLLGGADEIITIGKDQFFRKTGSMQWDKSSATASQSNPFRKYITDLVFLGAGTFKKTGAQAINGIYCAVYKDVDIPGQQKTSNTIYWTIWLRTSDGLPFKVSGALDSGKVLNEYTFSDYNTEIKIAAPRP